MWGWFKKKKKPQLELVCMRQEDTWRWQRHLGEKTEGVCSQCNAPIYFEIQNGNIENKICNRCAHPGSEHMARAYRDLIMGKGFV